MRRNKLGSRPLAELHPGRLSCHLTPALTFRIRARLRICGIAVIQDGALASRRRCAAASSAERYLASARGRVVHLGLIFFLLFGRTS